MSDKIRLAESLYGGFVICPHSGRILAHLPGDDKVTCFCPRSSGGTHRVAELAMSTAAKWVEQISNKAEGGK